jgi:phage shock protein A
LPVRPEVREAQRLLAALDTAHAHAVGHLAQAVERRAEVLAEQDRLVATAKEALEQAVADMANQVSVELAAQLFDLGPAEVRRLAKAHPSLPGSPVSSDRPGAQTAGQRA